MNNSTRKEKKCFLSSMKFWGIFTAIITLAGFILAIIKGCDGPIIDTPIPPDVNSKVAYIENTFRPNDLLGDSLLSQDVQSIIDFQKATLESIVHWKAIISIKPISEFASFNNQQVLSMVNELFATLDQFDKEVIKALTAVLTITEYGKKNNIRYYIPKETDLAFLMLKVNKRQMMIKNVQKEALKNFLELANKYLDKPDEIPVEEVIKLLEPYELLYRGLDAMNYYDEIYAECIRLNDNYMHYLNNVNRQD